MRLVEPSSRFSQGFFGASSWRDRFSFPCPQTCLLWMSVSDASFSFPGPEREGPWQPSLGYSQGSARRRHATHPLNLQEVISGPTDIVPQPPPYFPLAQGLQNPAASKSVPTSSWEVNACLRQPNGPSGKRRGSTLSAVEDSDSLDIQSGCGGHPPMYSAKHTLIPIHPPPPYPVHLPVHAAIHSAIQPTLSQFPG